MFDLISKPSCRISAWERRSLSEILAEAFEIPAAAAETAIDNYLATIPRILLAFSGVTLAGFHFYDELAVEGMPVFRLSLAAKSPCCGAHGMHRVMVSGMLWQAAARINPFGKIAMVGVCNNPRTYKNARAAGSVIFPDVLQPSRPFAYRQLYRQVAQRLGLDRLDPSTGVIEQRASSVGLVMPASAAADPRDSVYQGFLDYVGGDLNRGVFTMVVLRPLGAALRQAFRRACRGMR